MKGQITMKTKLVDPNEAYDISKYATSREDLGRIIVEYINRQIELSANCGLYKATINLDNLIDQIKRYNKYCDFDITVATLDKLISEIVRSGHYDSVTYRWGMSVANPSIGVIDWSAKKI